LVALRLAQRLELVETVDSRETPQSEVYQLTLHRLTSLPTPLILAFGGMLLTLPVAVETFALPQHNPPGPLVVNTGTWTPLAQTAPDNIILMLLLSDGTVMAKGTAGGNDGIGFAWWKLTPDASGSYVNGTWSSRAPMLETRLWLSSQILTDGRVFVAGGEYPNDVANGIFGRATAEIYDPVANTWTRIDPPASLLDPSMVSPVVSSYHQAFADSVSELLANGKVLIAPVLPKVWGGTLIYDPASNTWSAGPVYARNLPFQDEASWVKLSDGSVLTIDPAGTNSERYLPSSNSWVIDSNVPVNLYDPFGHELGAAFLLPNGKAFFLGSTGHTAIYTPSGLVSAGIWTAGADIPNSQGTPDAGAVMMVNGKILCAVSPAPTSAGSPGPTSFYEYDYVTNSFARVNGPTGPTEDHHCFISLFLDLPDGSVLYSNAGSQLYLYRPDGHTVASGKPTITAIRRNGDGSYHLTGTQLNGISEGAAYGDDAQMSTNYPLVRLSAGGSNVYYARTYNWSTAGVMTGATPVTTELVLPAGLPIGLYSVVAVANGIASDAVFLDTGTTPTPPPINVSGTIGYCSNPIPGPVQNVILSLTGTVSSSTISDEAGDYQFSSLISGGTYVVTPAKNPRAPGSSGIDTVDVIATQRHFLAITPLAGCRLTAANVNGDSTINTVDVIAIQRFFLGLATGTANAGNYKFTPASRNYSGITSDQTGQNYDAFILGDVAAPFAE
jgi:hypothetical protein